MDQKLQQAVDIVAEVCAKSVGNLQYHRTLEQAMSTILMALQPQQPVQAHCVNVETAVDAMAKPVEHWEKEE